MVAISWAFTVGPVASPTDFTSRTLGASIRQQTEPFAPSSFTMRLQLDNSDGALTPGNGGTYSGFDWFQHGVFVSATVGATTADVFHGVVTDVDFADDGRYSSVTISATCWGSILARTRTSTTLATASLPWEEAVQEIAAAYVADDVLPKLGEDKGTVAAYLGTVGSPNYDPVLAPSTLNITPTIDAQSSWQTAFRTHFAAGVPCAMWATTIDTDTSGGTDYAVFHMGLIGDSLSRTVDATTFRFEAEPTAGALPLAEVRSGHTIDRMANYIYVENAAGVAVTAKTASVENYGRRDYRATESGISTADDRTRMAINLRERLSSVRYVPLRFSFNSLAVDAGAGSTFATLLDVRDGLWQAATLEYTPTGGTERVERVVITGRRLQISPSHTTITVDCLPAADYQSFVLDSAVLGVLGGSSVTYDAATVTYDDATVPYDGAPVTGNRLG